MSDKHIPEPWHAFDSEYGGFAIQGSDKNGSIILPILGRTCNFPNHSEANARRIVAAVNACAGIPTAELEAGVVRETRAVLEQLLYCLPLSDADVSRDLAEQRDRGLALLARFGRQP